MDQDGANITNLSDNAASDDRPSWSPDGLRLAFASNRDGNYEIYVMDADGSNQTNLTSNATEDRYPAWSPDGSKIAFYSFRDGNWEVYSMNIDGSSPSNLTNNSASDSYPAWSSDGSKIAFHTDRDGNQEIYVMDVNGAGQTNLTNNAAEDNAPSWSPVTSTIAFRSDRDGNQEIYLMNGDGSSPTRITSNSFADVDPSWSPDGAKLRFHSDRDGNQEIYTMNSDGTIQASLASDIAIDDEARWSPFLPSSHGFVWYTTVRDISLAATGAWHDIDLSSHIPSGATGAIVELVNTAATDHNAMVRGKEDTRDYMSNAAYGEIEAETHRWQIVKLDRNRLIEGYISNALVDFKLLGYTVGSDPIYFGVPPDITPATTGAWATVDVSDYVDSSTDGVILLVDSTASDDRDFAIREIGSGDTITSGELEQYGSTMYVSGIDASDQFQVYIEDSSVKVYLVARSKGSVVYYSTNVSVADPATGSWQELDADDASIPSGANGTILEVANSSVSTDYKLGIRHGEATHNWNADIDDGTHLQGIAGLDDSNRWEQYAQDADLDISIAAYTRLTPADIHADIDILIRKADGTVRGIIAENVADTRSIPDSTWQTVSAVYYFPGYTVVDDTDYLEIDLFAEATRNVTSTAMALSFRIDDSSLAVADQSRIREDVPTVFPPPPTYASGKYTGDGNDGRLITGVGFQPDIVIIKADAAQTPVIRTSSMVGDSAKPVLKVALAANLIQTLETDGFTLGTDAKVNSDGVTYYWSAFIAIPGEIKVGTYVGNDSAQAIDGIGFAPEAVIVMAAEDHEMNIRTSAMPSALSMQLDDEAGKTNRITSLSADGFTVATSGQVNDNRVIYHYIAWNAVAGKCRSGLTKVTAWTTGRSPVQGSNQSTS
jgi:dipeptidyl aminopeptidase/acylaminoacyl peptidase